MPDRSDTPSGPTDVPLYAVRRRLAGLGRLGRLLLFGFEQIILSRLFEQRAHALTDALLKTKGIVRPPPEIRVERSGELIPSWTHGFSSVYAALFLNLHGPDRQSRIRYARPAPAFRAIYLWDSAFIAQIWKWWEPEAAEDVLNAVLAARDGNRIQHFASEFTRSVYTQPPLLAWAYEALRSANAEDDATALAERYRVLDAYHQWLCAHRQLPNGLFAWAHPYESGVENAPRFGARDERRQRDTRQSAAPDFSAYALLQCEALEGMAQRLGRAADALRHAQAAQALREACNAHLWDEESGYYFDRDARSRGFIRNHSIASLMPLWAGVPDRARAARIYQALADPDAFNTLIPAPSVALNDPRFERDMWRGPVWINTAYAVVKGLERYGFHDLAADYAFRLCDGVYRTHARSGHFYEFYDPTALGVDNLYRKRGNRWKRLTLGGGPVADFVGWTGLVNTLFLETLLGLRLIDGQGCMQPRFPAQAVGLRFTLTLPLWELALSLDVLPGQIVQGEAVCVGERTSFKAAFGERVSIGRAAAQAKALA